MHVKQVDALLVVAHGPHMHYHFAMTNKGTEVCLIT